MTKFSRSTSVVALMAATAMMIASPAQSIDPVSSSSAASGALPANDDGSRSSGFLSGIFGCTADGGKQVPGAVIGGLLGGFLGNRIAGRKSRTLGTVIGGALGAAAGSSIGCKLQKKDQDKAERAMEDAVATGKSQSWESADTGASGKVEVAGSASGSGIAGLDFANGVEPADGFSKVGASFISTAPANIRSKPGMDGKVLGSLATGQRVWVPASVQGAPWYLISDQNTGQGYVSNALLKRDATQTASACRMVKQTVEVPGSGSASESYQACKGKDGAWVMTRV